MTAKFVSLLGRVPTFFLANCLQALKRLVQSLCVMVAAATIVVSASAQNSFAPQVAIGVSPFAVYDAGEVDNVNPVNGNVFLNIPLLHYPQLGHQLRLNFNIVYNDKAWFIANYTGQYVNSGGSITQPQGNWSYYPCVASCTGGPNVMGVHVLRDQHLSFGADDEMSNYSGNGGVQSYGSYSVTTHIFSFYVSEADGAKHYYGDSTYSSCSAQSGICPGSSYFPSEVYSTNDGTGYAPQAPVGTGGATGPGSPIQAGATNSMTGPDGLTYTLNTASGYELITDTSGNSISQNSAGWFDSMRRQIPGTYNTTGTPAQPYSGVPDEPVPGTPIAVPSSCPSGTSVAYQWTVPAVGGTSAIYYFCYESLAYTTNFNLNGLFPQTSPSGFTYAGIGEASGHSLMLMAIVLPNSQSYRFSYDQYLSLTNLTLPTGGSIAYTWQIVPFTLVACPRF